jgi:hypothetical protein
MNQPTIPARHGSAPARIGFEESDSTGMSRFSYYEGQVEKPDPFVWAIYIRLASQPIYAERFKAIRGTLAHTTSCRVSAR